MVFILKIFKMVLKNVYLRLFLFFLFEVNEFVENFVMFVLNLWINNVYICEK